MTFIIDRQDKVTDNTADIVMRSFRDHETVLEMDDVDKFPTLRREKRV